MPDATPRLGVVIVTHDSSELIDACLDALPAAAPGLPLDVVVVDNDSADDVVARAEDRSIYARAVRSSSLSGLAMQYYGQHTNVFFHHH